MTGTFVNTGAVIVGSMIGLSFGKFLPDRIKDIALQALGLAVVLIGLQMSLSEEVNLIAVIACLLLGAVAGELIKIEQGIAACGEWLKERTGSSSGTFVKGFVSASLIYITGAMTIVGSIQDGTLGDPSILYVKSLLDGTMSIALASTYGIGVAFSALSVLVVQGGITLLASCLLFLREPAVLSMITATGGLLILGIGINILNLTTIKVGNLIPALVFAVFWGLWGG